MDIFEQLLSDAKAKINATNTLIASTSKQSVTTNNEIEIKTENVGNNKNKIISGIVIVGVAVGGFFAYKKMRG